MPVTFDKHPLQQHILAISRPGSPPDIARIPAMAVTARGSILCAWEQRHGGDWDCCGIALRRSEDGGASWSVPVQIFAAPPGGNANNPVLLVRNDGTVLFLWCEAYARTFCAVSSDDGLTFRAQTEITAAMAEVRARNGFNWDICATGPGHGIELRNGVLLVPFWLADSGGARAHRPSAAGVLRSGDGGESWQNGQLFTARGEGFTNPSEACLAELPNGDILLNLRHEGNIRRRMTAISHNGGLSFSAPQPARALPDPICLGSMAAQPEQELLAFCNCKSESARENLTLRFSADGGENWPISQKIAALGSYSDLAFSRDGKQLYLFYEHGRYEGLTFESYALADFGL